MIEPTVHHFDYRLIIEGQTIGVFNTIKEAQVFAERTTSGVKTAIIPVPILSIVFTDEET